MTDGLAHPIDLLVTNTKRLLNPAPDPSSFLRWDSPGVETIGEDEDAKTLQIRHVMNEMQRRNFAKHRHCFRATHVKTQGIVKGTLEVKADLEARLQQGLFVAGRKYDVVARYANEPYLLQDDKEVGPRGMGMKVFGVTGTNLDGSAGDTTSQDFLFNNAPMLELTDLDTCLDIMSLRLRYFDDPAGLGVPLKLRTDALKQHAPYQLPNTDIIGHAMYTQSAFRFGDWYGHLGLFPVKREMEKAGERTVGKNDPDTILKDRLFDYFAGDDAVYEFRIQVGTDPLHHPTEDASVVWDEKTAPWRTLATVTFPKQDSFKHERRVFWEDRMKLSPWAGIVDHKPLGSVNRLRKGVYEGSREVRDEINCGKSEDVRSVDEIP